MIEEIKQLDIFNEFDNDELTLISKYFIIKSYKADDIIVRQGDIDKHLFIVINGKIVSTLKLPGTIDSKHGEFNTGDFFGESSIFGNKSLTGTYIAAENSKLLLIPEQSFTGLIESNPECATRFISGVLSRTIKQLRKSSGFLADIVQWGENASRRVITDELTGIYNRAFLDDALENFFNISKSNSKPLSLLMLDVDSCRKINETIDLEAGNQIICEFAVIIKNVISKQGIAARYGGDEFSVLLPETNLDQATAIAEQIRRDVERYDFSKYLHGRDIKVTVSVGVSSYPETAEDLVSFKEKADKSLYLAKESGRNRVAHVK